MTIAPNAMAVLDWSGLALFGGPWPVENAPMNRSRAGEEQIAYAVRQTDSGTAVADVSRQIGVSEATLYVWKKK